MTRGQFGIDGLVLEKDVASAQGFASAAAAVSPAYFCTNILIAIAAESVLPFSITKVLTLV
jgi:hypothetical protein